MAEHELAVPPHGIIGQVMAGGFRLEGRGGGCADFLRADLAQGWDGDGKAIDGERDAFPVSGEFTTYAMAKV